MTGSQKLQPKEPEKVDLREEQIQKIIEKSGHDLHVRVQKQLELGGWTVTSSPYYNDPVTGKPREIDLMAKKEITVGGRRDPAVINVRLFIECKYLSKPIVLWFDEKNTEQATKLAMNNSILRHLHPSCVENMGVLPRQVNHYAAAGGVMKQSARDGNEDPLFEGMNGCLSALQFFEHIGNKGPYSIDLPIIVVEPISQMVRRDPTAEKGYVPVNGPVQWEVDYSFYFKNKERAETRYFLIDIVSAESLPDFLDDIRNNDIAILREQLEFKLQNEAAERAFEPQVEDSWGV